MSDPTEVSILVVEDSSFNRLVLRKRLGELGYARITEAVDGIEGLAAIAAHRFDVVLLDLEMPRLDGIGVLEALREGALDTSRAGARPAPPVIVISALTEMEGIVRCIELGAEDYLPKSFDPPLLRARLGAVLEKKRLRDLADSRLAALEAELESARSAQLSLVPRDFAAIAPAGLSLHAAMIPARQVGGDLYDAVRLAPDRLLICVADVAGKGAPAGLTMARTVGLMRAAAQLLQASTGAAPDPAAILLRANADLARDNESETFVTVVMAVLDAATGEGRIVIAGHDPPTVIDATGARLLTGLTRQPPLGAMDGYPYRSDPLSLAPGQALFLFSDGVTEAEDAGERFFGRARLDALLNQAGGGTPEAVVRAVLAAVDDFAAGMPQADDITALLVRREPAGTA